MTITKKRDVNAAINEIIANEYNMYMLMNNYGVRNNLLVK